MARPRARPVDRDHLPPQPLHLPVDNEEGDQERGDDSSPGPNPEHRGRRKRLSEDQEELETPQGRSSL